MGSEEKKGLNKIFAFFGNKRTRFGFSLVSLCYLLFLGRIAWLTFAYHFVYDNAAAIFFLYTFINVMFAIVMIYTRRSIITQVATLIIPPLLLVMLIYGFGNWYLILPPLIAAVVIFFASGVNETLKVVLGTIYMILFVLAFLAYITLESLTIKIPFKMDLHLRENPEVEIAYRVDSDGDGRLPFRLVAYVDPETKANRTASFFIERTDLDKSSWNFTCERVYGSVKAGTLSYEREYELKWIAPNMLLIDGRLIEIDEDGKIITVDNEDVNNETAVINE